MSKFGTLEMQDPSGDAKELKWAHFMMFLRQRIARAVFQEFQREVENSRKLERNQQNRKKSEKTLKKAENKWK